MSSYSCVLPVNWNLLWERVVPAWLSVLSGTLEPREFYAKYVPAGDRYADDSWFDECNFAPVYDLSLFAGPLHPPYLRPDLYNSGKCSAFLQGGDFPDLLEAAIKQTAAVNLPGSDTYAGDYYATTSDRSGMKQVAGTKNRYDFLERAFEVRLLSQDHHFYAYSRRPQGASSELQELLESLFLYQRVIPGTLFASESPAWPCYDDPSFAGYLSPAEVAALQHELAFWEEPLLIEDELLLLFTDRVRRAAKSGFGLLTIHAGL